MFNSKYTFRSFVFDAQDGKNSYPYATALAVAEKPGKAFNPLVLCGGDGLGKTHLLHAIGQHICCHKRGARVAYLSAIDFASEHIEAITNKQLPAFREKYLQNDVLLIDDLQFLIGNERFQEELFNICNFLIEANKQIVITCKCFEGKFRGWEQRFVARFEIGVTAELQPPDARARLMILNKKSKLMNIQLPTKILHFIASNFRSNIRRLETAMIKVDAYSALTCKTLPVKLVENLLLEMIHDEGRAT